MVKKCILIVDDNQFFLQQQISILGKHQFDIVTASSGADAIDRARSLLPDLILMDQVMPDMSGLEACATLKRDPLTECIPIIVVSSGDRELARKFVPLLGCDALIFKPISKDLLLTMVEELLGQHVRHWERTAVCLPCKAQAEGWQVEGTILSLSGGGAFLRLPAPTIPGDTFSLEFKLPDNPTTFSVRTATVAWKGRLDHEGPEGAGIRFLAIHPDDQALLSDFVNARLEAEEG